MTGPLNAPRPSRFIDLNNRVPDARWEQIEEQARASTEDNGWWIAGQDVVAEAEQVTAAEAARRERMRRWETSGRIRRGDPGE